MARLPQPGADQGTWGDILNEYLSQVHKSDGTLRDNIISEAQLATPVVAKLNTITGPIGPAGPQGPAGADGIDGTNGIDGADGATGPAGPQGPAGVDGADGTSVTIVGNVATVGLLPILTLGDAGNGYLTNDDGHLHVWSGTVWTDVGPVRGPAGPQGPAGADGIDGTNGIDGADGATGPIGPAGPQGPVGPAGATTIAGISGLQTELDGKASTTHTHVAADIASGTVATARLGSGTANNTTYLRGDGTWTAPANNLTNVVAQSTAYTAVANDFVLVSASSGSVTITLPSPVTGIRVGVKKVDASANAVTVSGNIDSSTEWSTSTQWESQDFLSDGTKWYFI